MTVTIPDYVEAEANVAVWFVPAIASATGAPTVAEIAAGVNLTCYSPEVWGGVTAEQNRGEQRRMCSRETFETLGRIRRSVADFTLTYLPQSLDTPGNTANKPIEMMAEGTPGWLVIRYGLDSQAAAVAGQVVDTLEVISGVQNKATGGGDEFAPLTYTQGVSSQSQLYENKVVLA